MKEIISQKNVLMLFIAIPVFGLVFGAFMCYENNRNKETIVDLGNGWKSYTHENLRFVVKIPGDAEIEAGVTGTKNEQFIARFSKGYIEYVRAYSSGNRDNPDDADVVERMYIGYCKNWKYNPEISKYKSWCEKIEINGKTTIVPFSEAIYEHKNEIVLKFDDPEILGKRKTHHISFKKEIATYTKQITDEHQNFTQKEVDDFVKEKTEVIKDLIVSINDY